VATSSQLTNDHCGTDLTIPRCVYLTLSMLGAWSAYAGQNDDAPNIKTVTVAVASNFKDVHESLAQEFCSKRATKIETISGSTGKLYAQVKNGAPFDVLLSADRKHAALLEDDGLAVKGSRFTYAEGRLALYSAIQTIGDDWEQFLKSDSIKKLAIANPDVAPYGAAAIDVLKKLGLDSAFEGKLVKGENISQTLQFTESGGVEAGFVALALLLSKPASAYAIIPAEFHTPIFQDAVLLKHGQDNANAKAYLSYLRSDEAQKAIRSAGYALSTPAANVKIENK
jgi:molybdate transport system substrate-binding protein